MHWPCCQYVHFYHESEDRSFLMPGFPCTLTTAYGQIPPAPEPAGIRESGERAGHARIRESEERASGESIRPKKLEFEGHLHF